MHVSVKNAKDTKYCNYRVSPKMYSFTHATNLGNATTSASSPNNIITTTEPNTTRFINVSLIILCILS